MKILRPRAAFMQRQRPARHKRCIYLTYAAHYLVNALGEAATCNKAACLNTQAHGLAGLGRLNPRHCLLAPTTAHLIYGRLSFHSQHPSVGTPTECASVESRSRAQQLSTHEQGTSATTLRRPTHEVLKVAVVHSMNAFQAIALFAHRDMVSD